MVVCLGRVCPSNAWVENLPINIYHSARVELSINRYLLYLFNFSFFSKNKTK